MHGLEININSQNGQLHCANMHNINWSDLRFVLTVAQAGSAAAAARALKVNHATVIRRIRAFEQVHNLRVFDHLASGYRLTSQGAMFLDAARSIAAAVSELERKMVGLQDELAGNIRITTTDGLFPVLAPCLNDFQQNYPQVTLDVLLTNLALDLNALDADIALRPTPKPPANLAARHICDLAFAVYRAPSLAVDSIHNAPWLGLYGPLSASIAGQWLSSTINPSQIILRCNSFVSLLQLVEQGMGLAVLPCYLGDQNNNISRVMAEPLNIRNPLWLLSHIDVLRSQRVQVCMDYLFNAIKTQAHLLEGR